LRDRGKTEEGLGYLGIYPDDPFGNRSTGKEANEMIERYDKRLRGMKWALIVLAVVLVVMMIVLWVLEERSKMIDALSECYLMSEVELCYRPQDVLLSTGCIYDRANDTYLRFVPSETACTPLNHPNEMGFVYTRVQWTSACGRCLKDAQWVGDAVDIWGCPKKIAMEVMADESPLDQCYTRCRRSLLLDFDWCAQACRCALGYDICSTGGQLAHVSR